MSATPDVTQGPHWTLPPADSACGAYTADHEVRIVVTGELDVATVPALDQALNRAETSSRRVILDLRQLEFIDCCALRLLLAASRRLRDRGGQLVLVRGSAEVDWFFDLVGVASELDFFDPPADDAVPGDTATWSTTVRCRCDARASTAGVRPTASARTHV